MTAQPSISDGEAARRWAPVIERAKKIAADLAGRAVATEAARQVPSETMQLLYREALLRHFQPVRHGGDGSPWGIQFDIGRVLAQSCPSTAWIATVVAANNCYACRFPDAAQEEIYDGGHDVLVANASVQQGVRLTPEHGGYRVSGRWKFASGIDHAHWVLVSGTPSDRDGAPAGPPMFLLLPARDHTIEDTWFVSGMRGTGSKDIAATEAFVPAGRAMPMATFWGPGPPGGHTDDPFIWRKPLAGYFGTSLLGPIVGIAEGGLKAYTEITGVRVGAMSSDTVAEQPTVQLRLAESAAEIDTARRVVRAQIHRLRGYGERDEAPDADTVRAMTRDRAFAVRLCQNGLERLASTMGAMGLFDGNPVHRHLRDLNAAAAQIAVNYDRGMIPFGQKALGIEPTPSMI
ncbi:MAG: acyl-CoA dehydrogenase family protein [Proteobacteria bacterium]|nr:acyl-CoA dehydrogenase family protein [Pseudomonadota bacterium]MDA1059945.1 acyl-CoA dehydrogenase family protein [Pseudomonadota bacterium]